MNACRWGYTVAFVFAVPLFGADMILVHGHVYTGNPEAPWAQSLAVTRSRIEALGTDAEILRRNEPKTKVIDLGGRTVVPGFIDVHTHMMYGAMALRGFNLSTPTIDISPADQDAFVNAIRAYAASHRSDKILFGRANFPLRPDPALKIDILDRAAPDRPVVIHSTSEHALWVNSRMLALTGVTAKPVTDPVIEKFIGREPTGRPTGVFRESSMQLINRALPPMSVAQRAKLLRDAAAFVNSYGITTVVELTGDLPELEAWSYLRAQGKLTVRTRTAFGKVAVNHHPTPEIFAELDKARTRYHDDWISANLVKFFYDGVGNPPPIFYEPSDYEKVISELDNRGYQIVTHAIGDAAIHAVLESYERVEKNNGSRDRRFRMEHLFSILSEDMPRFAELEIVAGMQPAFCCGFLGGERGNQFGSVQRSGAVLTFSSDWPCSWPPSPLAGIQQAVMREVRRPWRREAPHRTH